MTDTASKSLTGITTSEDFDLAQDRPGPREKRIGEMLRVDHAGEYGAVQIYRGQKAVFKNLPHKKNTAELIEEMEAGEQNHLETFDRLLAERQVRPTLLSPIWNAAGFMLGAGTALMSEKSSYGVYRSCRRSHRKALR